VGCEAKQHYGVKKIMMMNIGQVAGELAQGLFCRLPTKADDAVGHVMNPKALQNTLKLAENQGRQGLDLRGVHLHLPDILEGHGDVLALNKPILSDTVFSGSNGVNGRQLAQTLKLDDPKGEGVAFKNLADYRSLSDDVTRPGVTISGGELDNVRLENVRGVELEGLSARNVNAKNTDLTITPQHHKGKQLPSQIDRLTLEHSDAHVQGGFVRPTVASVDIQPPARSYFKPESSLTVSDGNAVGGITIHNGAELKLNAEGSSTPVGPIELKPGAKAGLSGNLGPVTANDAADLRIYPSNLRSVSSTSTPTNITVLGSDHSPPISLGPIEITDSPNATLHLNRVRLTDGLNVNGGKTGYVSLGDVTSEKPITLSNIALIRENNSDSTLSVTGSKAPEINLRGLSSTVQGRHPTVHLEGNNTPLTTVTGKGIDLEITNPMGLDGSPASNHHLSLRDSGIALKTSPELRPTFNFDGSNGTTIGLVPDRGVKNQVTFPNLTIKDSDGIEVWSPAGVDVGKLDVRGSKVKLQLQGSANTVNLTNTELDPNSFLSPTRLTLTNPQGKSGLRLLDPNTIFKSITNEGTIPQVKTGSATIVDAGPFGTLEIAGSGHQVAINNSRVPGARLEGGAGPNVTLSDTNFSDARVVRTQADIGKPVSYPGVNDEASTIRGLREEGGLRSKIRNVGYRIQDAWGSFFGGDRRSL
jgi:hypothetical protein